jgi:hypothetical protein
MGVQDPDFPAITEAQRVWQDNYLAMVDAQNNGITPSFGDGDYVQVIDRVTGIPFLPLVSDFGGGGSGGSGGLTAYWPPTSGYWVEEEPGRFVHELTADDLNKLIYVLDFTTGGNYVFWIPDGFQMADTDRIGTAVYNISSVTVAFESNSPILNTTSITAIEPSGGLGQSMYLEYSPISVLGGISRFVVSLYGMNTLRYTDVTGLVGSQTLSDNSSGIVSVTTQSGGDTDIVLPTGITSDATITIQKSWTSDIGTSINISPAPGVSITPANVTLTENGESATFLRARATATFFLIDRFKPSLYEEP